MQLGALQQAEWRKAVLVPEGLHMKQLSNSQTMLAGFPFSMLFAGPPIPLCRKQKKFPHLYRFLAKKARDCLAKDSAWCGD